MASISDFNVNLSDGGINWSTSDPNFENSYVYIEIKQADGSAISFSDNISSVGTGGFGWISFGYQTSPNVIQPVFPLTLEFIINDDNDPNNVGNNDSKFIYNITSATDDIFDNGNILSEGPFIDISYYSGFQH